MYPPRDLGRFNCAGRYVFEPQQKEHHTMTTLHDIIERRLSEERNGLNEAEMILSEQRGKVALLQEIAEELGEQVAEERRPDPVFPQSVIDIATNGFSRDRVEIALEVYEELIRRVSPESLRPFHCAPVDNTVLNWMTVHGGGVQGLRSWAINSTEYFASVLERAGPQRRDLLIWDYEVIPAIIDRVDFRNETPVAPSQEEVDALIDKMTADQLAALRVKGGHDA